MAGRVLFAAMITFVSAGCERGETSLSVTNGCDATVDVAIDTADPRAASEYFDDLISEIEPGDSIGLDSSLSPGTFYVLVHPSSDQPLLHELPFTEDTPAVTLTLSGDDCTV